MGAETLTAALKAERVGNTWLARCPAHRDRTPSLSIACSATGKLLIHCFAGCSQRDVIAALKAAGHWPSRGATHEEVAPYSRKDDVHLDDRPHAGAMAIWSASQPARGTLAERYLHARGIDMPAPGTLRFHPGLKHPVGKYSPAIVALVACGSSGEPVAVHRTFLARDGSGKAPVTPQKMMLGPCSGGAVRLASGGNVLMVGEGIETCLSVMQVTGKPVWAALSAAGLRSLDLPPTVKNVIILADGDKAGECAAQAAARRWVRERRNVRIARPPAGLDFNDLLVGPRQLPEAA